MLAPSFNDLSPAEQANAMRLRVLDYQYASIDADVAAMRAQHNGDRFWWKNHDPNCVSCSVRARVVTTMESPVDRFIRRHNRPRRPTPARIRSGGPLPPVLVQVASRPAAQGWMD